MGCHKYCENEMFFVAKQTTRNEVTQNDIFWVKSPSPTPPAISVPFHSPLVNAGVLFLW